jgi:MFS family permease
VLDRHGARRLFLLAGVLGANCILLASFQSSLAAFAFAYAAACGLVGALGFYHVTQPTAARLSPAEPARAIIRLTIAGAFAAPAYLPLTAYLVDSTGWRDTLRVDAATVAAAFLFAALVIGRPDANPPAAAHARARPTHGDRAAYGPGCWSR